MANNGSASDFFRTGAHGVTNENWGYLERYGGIPTSGLSSNDYYCTTSGFFDLCTLSLVVFNSCSGLHLILWLALKERYPAVTKYHKLSAVAGFRTLFRHNWRVASVKNKKQLDLDMRFLVYLPTWSALQNWRIEWVCTIMSRSLDFEWDDFFKNWLVLCLHEDKPPGK